MLKSYQKPIVDFCDVVNDSGFCDNKSLPYGGEDGPGVADTKEREVELQEDEYQNQSEWGTLW